MSETKTSPSAHAEPAPPGAWPTTPAVVDHVADAHPERRPSGWRLAGILVALLVVLGLVGVGANQLYRAGANSVELELAARPVPDLAKQRALEAAILQDTARYVDNGTWYRIPVARAAEIIVKDPNRLRAWPAPKGWVHPDDQKKAPPASP